MQLYSAMPYTTDTTCTTSGVDAFACPYLPSFLPSSFLYNLLQDPSGCGAPGGLLAFHAVLVCHVLLQREPIVSSAIVSSGLSVMYFFSVNLCGIWPASQSTSASWPRLGEAGRGWARLAEVGRGWARLEAALRLLWRWRGVLEGALAEASARLFCTWACTGCRSTGWRPRAAR